MPAGATFLTEGPTLANIVEFYGQRKAYGLSVSPNPIRRNPAYDPINNPDRALQLNQIQYIATDIWSAQRSPFFNSLLLPLRLPIPRRARLSAIRRRGGSPRGEPPTRS